MTPEPNQRIPRGLALGVVLALTGLVFLAGRLTLPWPSFADGQGDKVRHIVAYALLSVGWLLAIRSPGAFARAAIVLAILALTGAADEWTQPFFGRRSSSWDWVADMAGGLAPIAIFLAYRLATAGRSNALGPALEGACHDRRIPDHKAPSMVEQPENSIDSHSMLGK